MEITAEHAKAVGPALRIGVEKGFFDGIALHAAHVAPGQP